MLQVFKFRFHLFISSSIEDCICDGVLCLLLLPLPLVPVEEGDRLHDQAQLEQAHEQEPDAGDKPKFDGRQCLSWNNLQM